MNEKDTAKITERNPEQGDHLFKPRRCYSNPCGASISWNKNRAIAAADRGSWKRERKNRHLKDTLQELGRKQNPCQLGKKENRRQRSDKGSFLKEVRAMKKKKQPLPSCFADFFLNEKR